MLQNAYLFAKIGADTAENARNFTKKLATTAGLVRGSLGVPRAPAELPRDGPGAPAPPRALLGPRRDKTWKLGKISNSLKTFAVFWRARSRLYQNEILQENMRWTAFFKLYEICTLLHHSKLNIKCLAKDLRNYY